MTTLDDNTRSTRRQVAAKWATYYSLEIALVCAVIHVETGGTWDTFSSRQEDEFYKKYVDGKQMPPDSLRSVRTEAVERGISFGLMQVMGQAARELGFAGRFLTSLCDPEIGVHFGCLKLFNCMRKSAFDKTKALALYNGGSDATYPARVLEVIDAYEEPTQEVETAQSEPEKAGSQSAS